MLPVGTPFGFYNAPVSKALLVITGAASTLNILLPVLKIQTLIDSGILNYIHNSYIIRGLLRCLCYSNGRNLFFGSFLLYNFRIFEHRYGSKKYFDYILASTVLGAGLQCALMLTQDLKMEDFPTGPFWMIFSLFVPFYLSIPSVNSSSFFRSIPLTGKLFTYMMGLQMLLSNKGTFLSGASGMIAGVLCHFNVFYIQRWLIVPRAISNVCSRMFGSLFQTATVDSTETPQGATLEIQRQIRMDELDQQMWNLQQIDTTQRRPIIGNPFFGPAVAGPSETNRSAASTQQPTTEVSEEQIQQLIEMGFTRYAVLQALTASNNDISIAMNILLAE
ncbi:ubiquitin-associated domain-containing protein 2-like isoform X2 [Dendronephthya gigantea]|uniref:ubiquitin-associated domain-containing protein 2-like isoform X2 n=1 Tax=Dendronephthya gigantea TaxID=151771 RepID=UPI00106D867D|nr:ubiquitin-associated domain-containing protein 2-like isoform X2 [Dendronephthya gigantea]